MDRPTMFEPRGAGSDTVVLPAYFPVPGFGVLPVNAFVLRAAEPVLIDTGLDALRSDFLAGLREVIDPSAIRWIWLTHIDPDHIGNLAAVLEAAPQARIVTSFVGSGKLAMHGFPVERTYLLNPGQKLDVGDRQLQAEKPPIFDAPETTGAFDTKTGSLFSADCCGALMAEPAESATDIPTEALREGMLGWATVDAPWLQVTDPKRFDERLTTMRNLQATTVLSSHLPPAPGMADALVAYLSAAPGSLPFVGPDQAALNQMMSPS